MEALRLVLRQSSANYRREETLDNKMTYPLPPPATVIGALHNACGYQEYHAMDISIQGKYGAMHREPYTDYCFLNSTMDDRGILVKMKNSSLLSSAYDKVASAKKPQNNSFRKRITIQVHNEELFQEFQDLKDLADEIKRFKEQRIKPVLDMAKVRRAALGKKKAGFPKQSDEFKRVANREKEIRETEKQIKEQLKEYETENYTKPISKFRSLTTSLKFYEVLTDIELVIHVRAEREVLDEILENIYNLKSIGRSEDFVQVQEAKIVTLIDSEDHEITSPYSGYIPYDEMRNGTVFSGKVKAGQSIKGTKYYLNKVYTVKDKKRLFQKEWVFYLSEYVINKTSNNVKLDLEDGREYIVSFI